MNEPTIFTKIINGDIPCHKVYEDDKTLAFLDIYPAAEGHTLIIPKSQIEFVWDLDDKDYTAVMETTKKVARHMREVTGKKYVGVKVIGTDVPHAHVQLIPFNESSEMFNPQRTDVEPDHAALAEVAKELYFE